MTNFEQASLVIMALQSVVLIAVLVVYAWQLSTMRGQLTAAQQASSGQNLLALANFLQSEDVREARRVVIETLEGRPFTSWTPQERRSAAKVCSSYGTAGIILEMQLVPSAPIIENWAKHSAVPYDSQGFHPGVSEARAKRADVLGLIRPPVRARGIWPERCRLTRAGADGAL